MAEDEQDEFKPVESTASHGFADLLDGLLKLGQSCLDRMSDEDRERITAEVVAAFGLEDQNKDENETEGDNKHD